jgi:peptide subunit release factor 1 (eRF1)
MNWKTAIWTLNNRDEAEEQNPDAVLDAIRAMIDQIEDYCEADTDGMGDWIANGDWDGNETPQQVAEEWDELQLQA